MEERFLGKVFILTLIYFFVELIGGVYYNSLALLNRFMVGVMIFYVWLESYKKFLHPEPIQELNVLVIAILGLFVN